MADSKIPATFKALVPFVRRAEELERDATRPESKLIAYFCRQYAMELGIKLRENDSSDESTNYLLGLMDRLEEDKQKLPAFSQEEGKEICEDFALEIFAKADDEDRAGCADKNTARTFYAAGTFFDILNQFGEPSEDLLEKRRYCKYKAATILKAIKEGTTPTPGPPGAGYSTGEYGEDAPMKTEQPAPQVPSTPNGGFPTAPSFPTPPSPAVKTEPPAFPSFTATASTFTPSGVNSWSTTSAPAAPEPEQKYSPAPPTYSPPPPQPTFTPPPPPPQPVYAVPPQQTVAPFVPQTVPARAGGNPVSQSEINDAMECAKFAIAALKVKDVDLAIQRLEMALRAIK